MTYTLEGVKRKRVRYRNDGTVSDPLKGLVVGVALLACQSFVVGFVLGICVCLVVKLIEP